MSNRSMKRWSISSRDMQTKTTVRWNSQVWKATPVRMAQKKTRDNNIGEDMEKRRPLCMVGGIINWELAIIMENRMAVSQKTKKWTTIRSSNPIPGYTSKGIEISISKAYLHTQFIVSLLTIAKIWKQSKCRSAVECIKMWYIYTKEYRPWERRKSCHLGQWR